MTFSKALESVMLGNRVYRAGWNGESQYIELSKEVRFRTTQGIVTNDAIVFVGDGIHLGWTPTQTDMLSSDWLILSDENDWNANDNYVRGRVHDT